MNNYTIRHATKKDIPFLAKVVIEAEKGGSEILNYSTLFNLSEEEVERLIIEMFGHGIDGCEFSVTSYMVADYKEEPVAAFGAWVENSKGNKSSNIIKSNLINYTFSKESLEFLASKSYLLKNLIPVREPNALQLECLYVNKEHRGEGLGLKLTQKQEEFNKKNHPALNKVQVKLYANNEKAINVYKKNGFSIAKSYKSDHKEVFDYLPYNEILMMEKII